MPKGALATITYGTVLLSHYAQTALAHSHDFPFSVSDFDDLFFSQGAVDSGSTMVTDLSQKLTLNLEVEIRFAN